MDGVVNLSDGKYQFELKDGLVVAARRHGEDWPAGYELRFTNCFVAALNRILELEQAMGSPEQWIDRTPE